eukprot:GHVT01105073.1.p2 GENE.GHVT01105073.1~~GHVT01105073.1.p2  ORF type:complete len:106 (-),score=4.45 GHVT01105073.1:498-815(-)
MVCEDFLDFFSSQFLNSSCRIPHPISLCQYSHDDLFVSFVRFKPVGLPVMNAINKDAEEYARHSLAYKAYGRTACPHPFILLPHPLQPTLFPYLIPSYYYSKHCS